MKPKPTNTDIVTALCIACGLCCTGHLFTYAMLDDEELEPSKELGFSIRDDTENTLGFKLPCHLWSGKCTIYESASKPMVCGQYKCKLLMTVETHQIDLQDCLAVVKRVKEMILELETLMPELRTGNFRYKLISTVKRLENASSNSEQELEIRLKAGALIVFYLDKRFGIDDRYVVFNAMKPK